VTVNVVTAAKVVTPGGVLIDHAVTIDEGRIVAITPATGTADHAVLTPGFVDLQVNGHDDINVATMTEGDWARLRHLLLSQGVTSWCPTLITAPTSHYAERLDHLQRFTADSASGPYVAGVHLEGPFLGALAGAHENVPLGAIDLDWLRALPDLVRLVTLGPERPNAAEAIKLLTARGVVVALGHTAATYDETIAAIDAGARLYTHCFNASGALGHREPGPAGAALTSDDVGVSLIVDNVHVHPAMVDLARRAKSRDSVVLITDAVGWRSGHLGSRDVEFRDGAPRLADGTLAGSALTMDAAVRNAVSNGGFGLVEAVLAASTNPARLLGLDDRGEIVVGAHADLAALSDDLHHRSTWFEGRRVHG